MRRGRTIMQLVSNLERFIDFNDFIQIVGVDNLFLYSSVDGYRDGSEVKNGPIYSHTYGHVPNHDADGVVNTQQGILGIKAGEFNMQWGLRDVL